jgi:uncharacterized protein
MQRVKSLAMSAAIVSIAAGSACSPADKPAGQAPAAEAPKPAIPSDPYQAEIVKFQQDREALLKTDTGWLTIAGLWFLTQPETTFGSDPLNDIVLPGGAPSRAGTFIVRDGNVAVKAADGVTFQLDGKAVTSANLKPDGLGPPDRISLGDLQLWVHNSGERLSIRMRDRNNPLRKHFAGTSWFPINPAYRVEALYTPYDKPRVIGMPNILGDIDRMTMPGSVTFTINGQEHKLEAITEEDPPTRFWFVFRDLTSQKETYPAARFLYTPLPSNGRMILDFNKAQNPPCAYNPYTTCPLPTEQNRLRTRIEAGEMRYAGHGP